MAFRVFGVSRFCDCPAGVLFRRESAKGRKRELIRRARDRQKPRERETS
jgi:hypothetical protein